MRKKVAVLLIGIVLLFTIISNTYAGSFMVEGIIGTEKITQGQEVLINLEVSKIEDIKEGINVIEGTIVYDENIIDKIEIVDKNDWETVYNAENGSFLISKMTKGVKAKETFIQLKVKLNETINEEVESTEIKITNIKTNDEQTILSGEDCNIILNLTKDGNLVENTNNVKTGDLIPIIAIGAIILVILINIFVRVKRNKSKNK